MKKLNALKNLLNVLDNNNFVDLYYVGDYEKGKHISICFLTKDEAIQQMEYLSKKSDEHKKYYIGQTCVYCG